MYEEVKVRIDKWSFGWRLPKDKLEKLSTQRLLDLLKKKVRPAREYCGFEAFTDGNDKYLSLFNFYDIYYNDIKNILKDRPHLEKKKEEIWKERKK